MMQKLEAEMIQNVNNKFDYLDKNIFEELDARDNLKKEMEQQLVNDQTTLNML